MIAITGATGQLGRFVIASLLKKISADQLVALVRDPQKARDMADLGIEVRKAAYDVPETLGPALQDIEKLLLISSSEIGKRTQQHKAVINAAKSSGVKLVAYTSLLHADKKLLSLSIEHLETEKALQESGIPFVLLRNGWYTENYTGFIVPALEHNAFIGCAKEGKIASAPRRDYAEAAAVVLTQENQAGKVYELAGDDAYTLAEFTAEVARQSGKELAYVDLLEAEYAKSLTDVGLPEVIADMLADSDAGAAKGGLYDDSHTLSKLIARPVTPFSQMIAEALEKI